MDTYKFSDDFLFGTATSSVQIEGGNTNDSWYKWCQEGHIKDFSTCYKACDHWNRVEEDTVLLKELGVGTHRMSIEWSRIEPSPGVFSEEAIEHYRYEIKLLLENNIRPLVTLHHFSEPQWFLDMGGWVEKKSEAFIEFACYAVEKLGDFASDWVTFNEPNVYTNFGYILGCFPPGIRDMKMAFEVMSEIIKTHIKLYRLIHSIRKKKKFGGKTNVGAAFHLRVFDGLNKASDHVADMADYFFNRIFVEGMTEGKFLFPLKRDGFRSEKGIYADFLGINYYTRNVVEFAFDPSNFFYRCKNDECLDKSDLNWDIYPEGLYEVCKKYYGKYRLPIFITENGISDRYDNRRPKFIVDHLFATARAISEGIRIERYYHWTLMDNFEWLEGETAKFGLYECDFTTQKRTPRFSAFLYSDICKNKRISRKMLEGVKPKLK